MTNPHTPFGTHPAPINMSNAQKVSELLPCPFCGSRAIAGSTLDDGYYVMCADDNCWGLVGYLQGEADAIAAWNTRAAPTPDAHSEVGVKALEWVPIKANGGIWWQAENPLGGLPFEASSVEERDRKQADFSQRVQSCLAAGVVKAEPVAWVNAGTLRHHIESGAKQTTAVLHSSQGTLYGEKDIALYAALASKPEGEQ